MTMAQLFHFFEIFLSSLIIIFSNLSECKLFDLERLQHFEYAIVVLLLVIYFSAHCQKHCSFVRFI